MDREMSAQITLINELDHSSHTLWHLSFFLPFGFALVI